MGDYDDGVGIQISCKGSKGEICITLNSVKHVDENGGGFIGV